MKLGDIEFGSVLGASGVENFFGGKNAYPYHRWLKMAFPLGFRFKEMTFVAKTTTLNQNGGNMPMLDDGITPREFKPMCIVVNYRDLIVLNAVGLSGPGAINLLERGIWQQRTEPFMVSFMSIKLTPAERIEEACQFFKLLLEYLPNFKAPVALQINLSCPNRKGLDPRKLINEANAVLDAGRILGIPLVVKVNAFADVEAVAEIRGHDAICVSNAAPWDDLPNDQKLEYFGSFTSPLAEFGGGGWSGAPLLPYTVNWIQRARRAGITAPINAGGGILHRRDVVTLKNAGADSVFVGSAVMLRPWRLQSIIRQAHLSFGT